MLGCCQFQPTSLSSMTVLQPPLLCEGWGSHPLCLSGDSPVVMDLHWPCNCTAQSSIPSIGSVSLSWQGHVLWTCTGRNNMLPLSQLSVTSLVSTWHRWVDVFIVRLRSNGQKGAMMKPTATRLTWTGMGLVRLYLALESP